MGKTLGGFDSSHPKFDKSKYLRQLRGIIHWKRFKGKGTFLWATGTGKSTLAVIAFNKMRKKNPKATLTVVVPTTPLKEQWESNLRDSRITNYQVFVINTVSLNEEFSNSCDLLVLDEAHLFPAAKFRNLFNTISCRFIMCLTATLERSDGEHKLILQKAPICDEIPQIEAIKRGWITNFAEFNLAIPVTREESMKQSEYNQNISKYLRRFGDFQIMQQCLNRDNALRYIQSKKGSTYTPDKEELNNVIKDAVLCMANIRARKKFLDTTEHKIETAVKLIRAFKVKTIAFSQATAAATHLADLLGKSNAAPYHTELPSEQIMVPKEKQYKTAKGASRFMEKLRGKGYHPVVDPATFKVTWKEPGKISSQKAAVRNLKLFNDDKVNILCACTAIDMGYNKDDILLGIRISGVNNAGTHNQITGRIARNFTMGNGEKAPKVFINLYVPNWSVPNSADEKKVRTYQSKSKNNIIWVDDVDELIETVNAIFKNVV
jgi:superfamily II DNA or RNA helicase